MHAIGLNSWTGAEGSPVSSLICVRWQRLNLEPFNRSLSVPSVDTDVPKPRGLCRGPQGRDLCWAASLPARPRVPDGRAGVVRPTGQPA